MLTSSVDGGEFIAFWIGGGCELAGMNVNLWDVNDAIAALVRSGRPVDPVGSPTPRCLWLNCTPRPRKEHSHDRDRARHADEHLVVQLGYPGWMLSRRRSCWPVTCGYNWDQT